MRPLLLIACLGAGLVSSVQSFPTLAEPSGRLFFTPAQRAAMDLARLRGAPQPTVEHAAPPVPAAPSVRLDGVVQRSDGKRSVWLNGKMQDADGSAPGDRGRNRATIPIPGQGRIELKVGQTADGETGELIDPYPAAVPTDDGRPARRTQ